MKKALTSTMVVALVLWAAIAAATEHVVVPYSAGGDYWTGLVITSMGGDNLCITELDEWQNVTANQLMAIGCSGEPYQKSFVLHPETRIVHIQGGGHFHVTRVIGNGAICTTTGFESSNE